MGKGKLGKAVGCPWCCTPTLVRDDFGQDNGHGVNFVCSLCHTGFQLRNSPRVDFANAMFARDRAMRPTEQEHREFVGAKPLIERSVFELQRIEEILISKHPKSRASAEHITKSLACVQGELERRGVPLHTRAPLTYTIGEIYPPGYSGWPKA